MNLVEYAPYQGVSLTEKGQRLALHVLRSHRLVELYLVEKLGMSWDQVHAEADRWEHVLSDELADRMDSALGYPIYDPHGAPIPSRDGQIDRLDCTFLAELQAGQSARVAAVRDQTPALLRYLAEIGLTPGICLTVVEVGPFEGPLTLCLGQSDTNRVIGRNVAQKITLVDVTDQRANISANFA
jgi:DtxR family Mn-dependent transcriptional regulator